MIPNHSNNYNPQILFAQPSNTNSLQQQPGPILTAPQYVYQNIGPMNNNFISERYPINSYNQAQHPAQREEAKLKNQQDQNVFNEDQLNTNNDLVSPYENVYVDHEFTDPPAASHNKPERTQASSKNLEVVQMR